MFSWLTDTNILIGGLVLAAIQIVAALPWLRSIDPRGFDRSVQNPATLLYAVAAVLGIGLISAAIIGYKGDSSNLRLYGRLYGAALHLQLLIDLFLLAPVLLARVLPKTGAVALAAYREGWRQPMFWLVIVFAVLLTWIAVVLPYFTFGDDFKMMKQVGFDVVMLAAVLFGVLAASISISGRSRAGRPSP
jgi:hypothetical protein